MRAYRLCNRLERSMAYKQRILLDFDGVLHDYHGWNGGVIGEPLPRARGACFILERHYELVVFTSRENHEEILAALKRWGFPKMRVTNLKEPAFLQIDDRALCFTEWTDELLAAIQAFRPHWQSESTDGVNAARRTESQSA